MEIATVDDRTVAIEFESVPLAARGQANAVAGYVLQRRIGVGGYGEVWEAIGPGGLYKAVKILHGCYDGPQADAELKSLERIKSLRHPFLLNIERIEIVDNRVIIVTELAEGSLEERFRELRQEGQTGISREELLAYLRDVADALDFMSEHHGLQHLDIKPSNVLRQGEHAKVADFGMTKEIRQTDVSQIHGFTPLYSPPELFEGRPSGSSDQYSLAVLYQAMLTGTPPFSGRNAAQLAVQHLRSKPALAPLSLGDRPVVARALAKNPQARFPSCRRFVEALSECPRNESGSRPRGGAKRAGSNTATARRFASDGPSDHEKTDTTPVGPACPSAALPAVEFPASGVEYHPTIFVGIGGLGGQVLCRLRARLRTRFGHEGRLPALPLLYVDTDVTALCAARHDRESVVLNERETLAIPLRRAEECRNGSEQLLAWLSRRWLYNIPRSGQVEGIRPLGRLAFVHHNQNIRRTLHHLVADSTHGDSCRQTGQMTQLPFAPGTATVFVVASVSGGTGGGAMLDFGYLIREVLAEAGITPFTVAGILLCTDQSARQVREVQLANTLACLKELEHFSTPGLGYPGDAVCAIRARAGAPFDHTYLLPLGGGSEQRYEPELEQAAEYLFRSAATSSRAFLEACRCHEVAGPGSENRKLELRTFGLATPAGGRVKNIRREASLLCRAVVRSWNLNQAAGTPPQGCGNLAIAQWAQALLQELKLHAAQLNAEVGAVLRKVAVRPLQAYAAALAARQLGEQREPEGTLDALLGAMDRDFASFAADGGGSVELKQIVDSFSRPLGQSFRQAAATVCARILSLLSSADHRMAGTGEAIRQVVAQLQKTEAGLGPLLVEIERDGDRLRGTAEPRCGDSIPPDTTATAGSPRRSEEVQLVAQRYAMLKLCGLVCRSVLAQVGQVRLAAAALDDALTNTRLWLGELEATFVGPADGESQGGCLDGRPDLDPTKREALARHFAESLQTRGRVALAALVLKEVSREQFRELLLREAADFLIRNTMTTGPEGRGPEPASLAPSTPVSAVWPRLRDVGGGHRVLAVVPQGAGEADQDAGLAAEFGKCVTVQHDPQEDLFLCCEVSGMPLESVINQLAQPEALRLQTAYRLRTRTDIDWNNWFSRGPSDDPREDQF